MSRPKRVTAPTGLCPGCGKRVAVDGKGRAEGHGAMGGPLCRGTGARAKDVR
jgi:hypothetical protein